MSPYGDRRRARSGAAMEFLQFAEAFDFPLRKPLISARFDQLQAEQWGLQFLQQRLCFGDQLGFAFSAGQVAVAAEPAEQEIRQRYGLRHHAVEGRPAELANEAVRVLGYPAENKTDGFGRGVPRLFSSARHTALRPALSPSKPKRCGRPGAAVSARGSRMLAVPEGRQRVADTVLSQCDDVHVALDDDRRIRFTQGSTSLRQTEQLAAPNRAVFRAS